MRKHSFLLISILTLFSALNYGMNVLMISPSTQPSTFDGNAMTIDYHIVVNSTNGDQKLIKELITDTFNEIDQIYNKWNPDSEISRINRSRAYEVISISPELEHFLHLTNTMVEMSGGRFDPSIEPLLQIWKDHLEIGKVPSTTEIEAILPAVGWSHLHFAEGKIFKEHDKTSLDFGGIAKGYCVDLLIERIVEAGFDHVLVEWGGEIRAHGRYSEERPWKVFVSGIDDMDPQHAFAQINLENQSVATSGDYIQKWSVLQNDKEIVYFHIIDPRTAKPLESTQSSVASATVVAPTCLLADVLAKSAMMHPSLLEARAWADEMSKRYPNIKFWLFSRENENL